MKNKPDIEKNASTEEKIKQAALKVFTQKGFAATRTRDIAEESGYNLALINYYFRSKEKLFDIVMLELLQGFVKSVFGILNDSTTTLEDKIELLISHYIDMLIQNPDIPIFILNEAKADPDKLIEKLGVSDEIQQSLYIRRQWMEVITSGMAPDINPAHIIINIVALTIFPFAGRHMLKNRLNMNTEQYNALMEERKNLIPQWIKAMTGIRMKGQ